MPSKRDTVGDRRFPIQASRIEHRDGRIESIPATSVPWSEAEIAYETYAQLFGTQQSLERLAERGGFGRGEFTIFRAGMMIDSMNWGLRMIRDVPLVTELNDD